MTPTDRFLAHKAAYWDCGILHRDISSNNILWTTSNEFEGGLLIDWDLCKQINKEDPSSGGSRQFSRTVRYHNFSMFVS
jgi:RIO-like serine/threonine protein kinase